MSPNLRPYAEDVAYLVRTSPAARGAASAQEAMVGTLAAYYAQEYTEWVRSMSDVSERS